MNKTFIIERGLTKRRRHLYGSARVTIDQIHVHPTLYISLWYQQIYRPMSSVPATPTLPASAWDYTCAILYYTPAPCNPSQGPPIKGYLRIVRCPVDYAAPGNIPAIYRVAHSQPMFCCHHDWSNNTALVGGPCARLRFNLGDMISPATDGAWNTLVLADCPLTISLRMDCATSFHSPLSLTTPFDSIVYGGSLFTFEELIRAHKGDHDASPAPLHRGNINPDPSEIQSLLPRIFPLGKGGYVPADLVLTVYDAQADLHIQRWLRDNDETAHASISVDVLCKSCMFNLWLSAVL